MNKATPPALLRGLAASDAISRALSLAAAAAIVALLANVLLDVFGRVIFNHPINGTLELVAHWWMPAASLLAFAEAERRREHIRVMLLTEALTDFHRRVVDLITGVVAITLVGVVLNFTFLGAMADLALRRTTNGGLAVPIWPVAFIACLALAAFLLQLIASTIRSVWKPVETAHSPTTTIGALNDD